MTTSTTITIQGKEITLCHAAEIFSGYGHKRITVSLLFGKEKANFAATTSNMPACDVAADMEGSEKYQSLYEIVASKIEDQVIEWLKTVEDKN